MEALPDQSRRLTQASRPASPHHHVCHRHRPHFCRRRHRHRQRHRLLYQRNRRLLLLLLLLLLLPASRPASRLSSCSHIFDNTIFCSSHRRAVRAPRAPLEVMTANLSAARAPLTALNARPAVPGVLLLRPHTDVLALRRMSRAWALASTPTLARPAVKAELAARPPSNRHPVRARIARTCMRAAAMIL